MIKPLEDRVLIKIIDNEEKTKSGIIIKQNCESSIKTAEVVEIGNGKNEDGKQIKMLVKKEDKVLINKYAGTEVKYNNEDFIIIKQEEILAIIE